MIFYENFLDIIANFVRVLFGLPAIATIAASGLGSINVEINLQNVSLLSREMYIRANTKLILK